MIPDLVALYQFLCALFVTLCFDRIFRNFVWKKGTFRKILAHTETFDSNVINSKKFKDEICDILTEKYNSFFEHSKVFSFLNLAICFTFLFVSSCSYWHIPESHEVILYNFAQALIIIDSVILILFCLLRKQLFSQRWFVLLLVTTISFVIIFYYYKMIKGGNPIIAYYVPITTNQLKGIVSLSSILVFMPPFFYFYSHNLFFPKIYGFYIKEKLRCLNAETDARIAGLYDGSVLAVTGSTSQDLRAIYVNYENGIVQSIKDTLRHYDMLGILFIAIKLMTLRFFHWIRLKYYNFLNYKVGFIALIGRYGRFIRYNNKKNRIK